MSERDSVIKEVVQLCSGHAFDFASQFHRIVNLGINVLKLGFRVLFHNGGALLRR